MLKEGTKVIIVKINNNTNNKFSLFGEQHYVKKVVNGIGYVLDNSSLIWKPYEIAEYRKDEPIVRYDGRITYVYLNGKVGKARCHPLDKFDATIGIITALEQIKDIWPKEGDVYFYVDAKTDVKSGIFERYGWEYRILNAGNMFRTEEEALKAAEAIRGILSGTK